MVDRKPVRIDKHSATKALEQLAGWIKLQDRRIGIAATETGGDAGRHGVEAAMEDPNIAVAVDMYDQASNEDYDDEDDSDDDSDGFDGDGDSDYA